MNQRNLTDDLLQQLRTLASTKLGAPDERYNRHFESTLKPLSQLNTLEDVRLLQFEILLLEHATHHDILYASALLKVLTEVKALVNEYVDGLDANEQQLYKPFRDDLWDAIDKLGLFLAVYCVKQNDDQPIDAVELEKLKAEREGENEVPIVTVDVYEMWPVYSAVSALLVNKEDAESLLKLLSYGAAVKPIQLNASRIQLDIFAQALHNSGWLVAEDGNDVTKWIKENSEHRLLPSLNHL